MDKAEVEEDDSVGYVKNGDRTDGGEAGLDECFNCGK